MCSSWVVYVNFNYWVNLLFRITSFTKMATSPTWLEIHSQSKSLFQSTVRTWSYFNVDSAFSQMTFWYGNQSFLAPVEKPDTGMTYSPTIWTNKLLLICTNFANRRFIRCFHFRRTLIIRVWIVEIEGCASFIINNCNFHTFVIINNLDILVNIIWKTSYTSKFISSETNFETFLQPTMRKD